MYHIWLLKFISNNFSLSLSLSYSYSLILLCILSEFLAPGAHCPINIDSRIMAITKSKMENPDRYTYDEARVSISLSLSLLVFNLISIFRNIFSI